MSILAEFLSQLKLNRHKEVQELQKGLVPSAATCIQPVKKKKDRQQHYNNNISDLRTPLFSVTLKSSAYLKI